MLSLTSAPDAAPADTRLSSLALPVDSGPDDGPWAQNSLFAALARIPDPRSSQGRRHPLASLLALLIVALCCGANQVKGAVIFGRERKGLRRRLGFTHPVAPAQSTYSRLLARLEPDALQRALEDWLKQLARRWAERRAQPAAAAVDGKALRATGHHLLHVFVQDFWMLLDLRLVGEKQNELSAFERHLQAMLEAYPFIGAFTFDALFAQHTLARTLTAEGRRGVFQIKDNQRETRCRLERWFHAQPKASPAHAATEQQGDYIVTRRLYCAPAPADVRQLWPEARQIAAVAVHSEPRRPQANPRESELHLYLITGPKGQKRLRPGRLAALIRNHWGVENRLHHILDRTFREDHQRPRAPGAALILAWLRRVALGLLYSAAKRRNRPCFIPELRNILCAKPAKAVSMIMR